MRFLLGAELGRAAPTRAPMACGMSPRVSASPEAGSMAMKWLAKGKCLIDEPPWPFLMTRQHLQWARLVRKCGRPCGSAPRPRCRRRLQWLIKWQGASGSVWLGRHRNHEAPQAHVVAATANNGAPSTRC